MNKKQYVLLLAAAVVAGLVGGAASSWLLRGVPVQQTSQQGKVIRAERFEVVDAKGNVRAGFGMAEPGNAQTNPVLSFLREGTNNLGFDLEASGWSFWDKQGHMSARLMAYSDNPYLSFGNSGGPNLDVGFLSGGHPGIQITRNSTTIELTIKETGRGQLDMAAEDNEAELTVFPQSNPLGCSALNLTARDSSGKREREMHLGAWGNGPASLSIASGVHVDLLKDADSFKKLDERAEIDLGIEDDGPRVALKDSNGKLRAVLGQMDLESPSSGSVEKRPASSLVLFDKKEHLTWQTP